MSKEQSRGSGKINLDYGFVEACVGRCFVCMLSADVLFTHFFCGRFWCGFLRLNPLL